MGKFPAFAVNASLLLTVVSAVVWMYASHKYDCFNIGPCQGDVDIWIRWGDIAFYAFIGSWLALLISTFLCNKQITHIRPKIASWALAILLPVAVIFLASWLFNLGISASSA